MHNQPQSDGSGGEDQRELTLEVLSTSALPADESSELAEEKEEEIDGEAKNAELTYQIRLDRVEGRKSWNKTLKSLVIINFAMSMWLVILIGAGFLSFPSNAYAVPAVVGSGIFGTYGLSKLAIKYFFDDEESKR